jgi:glutathione synthase/RimK-type ligase-like ATP-grasp enzyme
MTRSVTRAAVIGVATCRADPVATADDGLGLSRLAARGQIVVETVPWDATPDWGRYDAVIIRSTWDYHLRVDAFLRWTEEVEAAGAALWNSAAVVRWNSDKKYLKDLEHAGVDVVPTEWVPRASEADLRDVLRRQGWRSAVVKPSVAATAYRTARVSESDVEEGESVFTSILQECDALVQPFLAEVRDSGEWSFVYFDDGARGLELSHAVLKRSSPEDFRVQPQFGGTAEVRVPPGEVLRQASHVARTVSRLAPGPVLYARVDGVVSDGEHAPEGTFLLMEAELIEPMLFLGSVEGGAERFADALARRVGAAAERFR